MCDEVIKEDEVLMLTDDNRVVHSFWVQDDQSWFDMHQSEKDQYTVQIN